MARRYTVRACIKFAFYCVMRLFLAIRASLFLWNWWQSLPPPFRFAVFRQHPQTTVTTQHGDACTISGNLNDSAFLRRRHTLEVLGGVADEVLDRLAVDERGRG